MPGGAIGGLNPTMILKSFAETTGNGLKEITMPGIEKVSDTEFRIYAGTRYVTDYATGLTTEAAWETQVITDTLITSDNITFACIDTSGVVVLRNSEPRDGDGDLFTQVGIASHNIKTIVDFVSLAPDLAINRPGSIRDLWDALKLRNIDPRGNLYEGFSTSTNQFKKTGGQVAGNRGRNASNNIYSANVTNLIAADPLVFWVDAFHDDTGNGTLAPPNIGGILDTTLYDDLSGTPATIPDGFWGTWRIYLEPASGLTIFTKPQTLHRGRVSAIQSILTEVYDPVSAADNWLLRGYVTAKAGTVGMKGNPNNVEILPANRDGDSPQNPITNGQAGLEAPFKSPFNFTSRGVNQGSFYTGFGNVLFSLTAANLTQVSTTQSFGTANGSYATHPFIVAGGPGVVAGGGQVGLRVNYDATITDAAVRSVGGTEVMTDDITTLSLDDILEAASKNLGAIEFELYVVSGAPTSYSLDFNYGMIKYDDNANRDFMIIGIECSLFADANDVSGFDVELYHWPVCGMTYAATGFDPLDTPLASLVGDHGPDNRIINNEYFNWKHTEGIDAPILGSQSEGYILKLTQGASGTVQSFQGKVTGVE